MRALTVLLRHGAWHFLSHPVIQPLIKGRGPQWQFTEAQQLARRAYREGVRMQALLRQALVLRAAEQPASDSGGGHVRGVAAASLADVCLPAEVVDKVYCAAGYCLPDSFE